MRFVQVLALVLAQLGIGTLLLTALVAPRMLPGPFFSFNSLLGTVLSAVALLLGRVSFGAAWWDMRFLGLTVIAGTLAYGCFRFDRRDLGRLLLILAGLLGLVLGLLPMSGKLLILWGVETRVPYGFAVTVLAGALLLGTSYVAMFVSHWGSYVPAALFRELVERKIWLVAAALAGRLVLLVVALTAMSRLDPDLARTYVPSLWTEDLALLAARVVFGLAIPAVFWGRALRALNPEASAQPAGALGFVFASVLVGELCAGFLLI